MGGLISVAERLMSEEKTKRQVLYAPGDLIIDYRKSWTLIQMQLRHTFTRKLLGKEYNDVSDPTLLSFQRA
jgi:hypothetical protein